MSEERSMTARAAAEMALSRVVSAYGAVPEFVVLGGLVPALLCSRSTHTHAGTTDIDVQANLEISASAQNAGRLEQALQQAGFSPTTERVWRWTAPAGLGLGPRAVVKFELLADLDDRPAGANIRFDGAARLGAVNLRGTGPAVEDAEIRTFTRLGPGQQLDQGDVQQGDVQQTDAQQVVQVRTTGLAGFLLAKVAAAQSRRTEKDWYDIAFVLLHNDRGGPREATAEVLDRFGPQTGSRHLRTMHSALLDLAGNFAADDAQGPSAYADQLVADHPGTDPAVAAADAQLAVTWFCETLLQHG